MTSLKGAFRPALVVLGAIVVAGLPACSSSPRITTDHDPSAVRSMQFWGTYDFLPHPGGEDDRASAIVSIRLEEAVNLVLADKGFRLLSEGTPDFRVGYHLALEGTMDVSSVNTYYEIGLGNTGSGGAWGTAAPTQPEFAEGALVLDIVDTQANLLVWRGWARTEIEPTTPMERKWEIREAVSQILHEFPPRTDFW